MVRTLGLYDSMLGQYCLKVSFLGIYFLIFYASVKSAGNEFAEAASIDGAGHFSIMYKIYFPLLASVFTGIVILDFIGFWSDYMTPLYYLPSFPTISYGLNYIQYATSNSVTIPIILGASLMSSIPVVLIFIIFRNKIMGNMSFGGLKG